MPEKTNNKTVFSLLEVTRSIQKTIAQRYSQAYWIKAEMIKLNYYEHSGHCYPDLVEKSNGRIVAQLRATLWKDDYQRANRNFLEILKEPLKDGIKILFQATISFHPEYGLTLRIVDIDASFTLGDLEHEKQETISKLRKEGIFGRNKSLPLPLLPKRIAIISVETSKGYADFLKVLHHAEEGWGYKFFHLLFPSLLQGDNAVDSIIKQLKRIERVKRHFDVVAIVRGGGGDVGLSCYNNYRLSRAIAEFPLPVFSGIGHATNETVAELISFENAITPTKLADTLVQRFHNFCVPLQKAEEAIFNKGIQKMREEKDKLNNTVRLIRSSTKGILSDRSLQQQEIAKTVFKSADYLIRQHAITLGVIKSAMTKLPTNLLKQQRLELENLAKNIEILSPQNVLRRGFSITEINGKTVSSVKNLKIGDKIKTHLADGNVDSTINSKDQEEGIKLH